MESSEQTILEDEAETSEPTSESKVEVVDLDLGKVPEVERKREPLTDLSKHVTKPAKIAEVKLVRMTSPYAKAADGKIHKLQVIGEVVEAVTTREGKVIQFRPTELIDVEEDENGAFTGYPKYEKSKYQRLKKMLRFPTPDKAVGMSLPMRINTNKKGQEFLGFLY